MSTPRATRRKKLLHTCIEALRNIEALKHSRTYYLLPPHNLDAAIALAREALDEVEAHARAGES